MILVLDQFEERIKRSENLDALYADIARLANTRSEAATVIISIREDYLAGLDRLMRRVSGLLDAGYRVPPLSRMALAEAVFRPLSIVAPDVTVEGSLVDAVLTDLEQQAPLAGSPERHIEPGYFQIVWHRLWEIDAQGPDAVLTLASYASEGGAAAILKSFVGRIMPPSPPYALQSAGLLGLVFECGLVILASGMSAALATWLAGMLSFLPNIQYMELSVGLAAVGAAFLYLIGYRVARKGGAHVNLTAARNALWPMPNRRSARFGSSGWRVPGRALWRARLLRSATSASYFFIWWPVLFTAFITASYLGAALFAALGWSATAGFNVGALFAGPLLAIAYGAACDL